jgi:hypothetical protein
MNAVDLLALPFDQYQRYMAVTQIAEQARARLGQSTLRVLDVGGFYHTRYGRNILPLAHFLPNDRVVAVDLVAEVLPAYVFADGGTLPFGNGSFDLVVSCDTLEHVPESARLAFVDEMLRVAAHFLVIAAPFASDATALAERILAEYMTSHGLRHAQLQEHSDLGLPNADHLRAHLAERNLASLDFADGYLHHWLPMMLIKHTPGYSLDFHLDLDRYYNLHFTPADRREPSYRRVFVVALPGDEALLPTITRSLRAAEEANDNTNFIPDLLRFLNRYPAEDLRAQVRALETENTRLRQLVEGYESGRFVRLMRWIHQQRVDLRNRKIA